MKVTQIITWVKSWFALLNSIIVITGLEVIVLTMGYKKYRKEKTKTN